MRDSINHHHQEARRFFFNNMYYTIIYEKSFLKDFLGSSFFTATDDVDGVTPSFDYDAAVPQFIHTHDVDFNVPLLLFESLLYSFPSDALLIVEKRL